MIWRNHYRSERGKFATQTEWPTREEAEARAALKNLRDQGIDAPYLRRGAA